MNISTTTVKNIYEHLGDECSKYLFKNQLMYSMTGDNQYVIEMVKTVPGGKDFLEKLEFCGGRGDSVIFGAGVWGGLLYDATPQVPFKCFIDNNPKVKEYMGLPVIKCETFLKMYQGEYIFICSKYYHQEMKCQLIRSGIPAYKIIDISEMNERFASMQYFDLEHLNSGEDPEVFLDVGAYDGNTSINFRGWSKEGAFSYLFEADEKNILKCHDTLTKNNLNYEIIPKAAWNCETKLHFRGAGMGNSRILKGEQERGTLISATTIDKEMQQRQAKPTFIKMDIEGAEYEALLGAEDTIRRYKPKLAISVYHKPEDIYVLPQIILEYNPSYKLYIRHYSFKAAETVLYAVDC